jgi:integrase
MRAYDTQWQRFQTWCRTRGVAPLPAAPVVVAQYVAENAQTGAAIASINVMLTAIRFSHRAAGLAFGRTHPALTLVLDGIRREHVRAQRQAEPLTGKLLSEILATLRRAPTDLRDAALLSLLYLFALRASEVVALDWMHGGTGSGRCTIGSEKAEVMLLGSMASACNPQAIVIPTRSNLLALQAIQAWVAHADIKPGEPLLRALTRGGVGGSRMHVGSVGALVKRAVARHLMRIGTPTEDAGAARRRFSGHSGRVGLYVSACEAGVPAQHTAALAAHTSMAMVLRYAHRAQMLRCSPHAWPEVGV